MTPVDQCRDIEEKFHDVATSAKTSAATTSAMTSAATTSAKTSTTTSEQFCDIDNWSRDIAQIGKIQSCNAKINVATSQQQCRNNSATRA